MKLQEILQYNDIFKNLIDNAKDINILVKFRLLGIMKQFEPYIANYQLIREEQIRQYGTQQENGSIAVIPPSKDNFENDEDFEAAEASFKESIDQITKILGELEQSEIDIDIKKFKADEIIDKGISADYLVLLYDFIEE